MNTKIEENCILLILNCKKYRYKALKQKETWLKDFTLMPYFHVIGDVEIETDYYFDHMEKILYVKTLDDYNSLPKKVIAAYTAVNNEYNFKYIFKTDDDQMLSDTHFFKVIKELVLNKVPTIHYGGYIVKIDDHKSKYHLIHPELPQNLPMLKTNYCSGRFYLLSALAIEYLITKTDLIRNNYFEDYAIGLNLDPILKKNILNIQTQKYFTDITDFTMV